ncbi:MAG: hypothetical protein ABFC96_01715 [Thermoguttaceae bacterium]
MASSLTWPGMGGRVDDAVPVKKARSHGLVFRDSAIDALLERCFDSRGIAPVAVGRNFWPRAGFLMQ